MYKEICVYDENGGGGVVVVVFLGGGGGGNGSYKTNLKTLDPSDKIHIFKSCFGITQ